MTRKIDLDPVRKHIVKKLIADRQRLSEILDSPEQDGLRGFEEQERLLAHIQAAVRALDVLEGESSPDSDEPERMQTGERTHTPSLSVARSIDMDKLAEALRPNGAAH